MTRPTEDTLPPLEKMMLAWAREGAEVCRTHYRRTGDLTFKAGREAVTEADREIEGLLRSRIKSAFPEDAVIGEELAPRAGSSGRTWHLDPIDGTLNFALGLPDFCISLALLDGTGVQAACVYQPLVDDGYTATRGGGARRNGQRLAVSDRSTLHEAVCSLHMEKEGRYLRDPVLLQTLFLKAMKVRKAGAIALELAWVAAGSYDALVADFGVGIQLYDVAAGMLLIQEAGGMVTDFHGGPFQAAGTHLVASNGLIHENLLGLGAAD